MLERYRSLHCGCWKEHVFDDIMFLYVTEITECYTFWQGIHSSCPRIFTALAKYSWWKGAITDRCAVGPRTPWYI